MTGTEDKGLVANFLHFQRPRINIKIGDPLYFPMVDKKDRHATLQRYTDEIMCHIAFMLPEFCRGVYTDHPRLLALERAQGAAPPGLPTQNETKR